VVLVVVLHGEEACLWLDLNANGWSHGVLTGLHKRPTIVQHDGSASGQIQRHRFGPFSGCRCVGLGFQCRQNDRWQRHHHTGIDVLLANHVPHHSGVVAVPVPDSACAATSTMAFFAPTTTFTCFILDQAALVRPISCRRRFQTATFTF
jgi:hypothetical protein